MKLCVVVSDVSGAFTSRSVRGVTDFCPSSMDNVIVQSSSRHFIPSAVQTARRGPVVCCLEDSWPRHSHRMALLRSRSTHAWYYTHLSFLESSSLDEIANVNFFNDGIVHVLQNSIIDSRINSATDRRSSSQPEAKHLNKESNGKAKLKR